VGKKTGKKGRNRNWHLEGKPPKKTQHNTKDMQKKGAKKNCSKDKKGGKGTGIFYQTPGKNCQEKKTRNGNICPIKPEKMRNKGGSENQLLPHGITKKKFGKKKKSGKKKNEKHTGGDR